ncbi:MAG: hypothetical protein ACHQLA_05985 [Ignavibacteriales bacterium]
MRSLKLFSFFVVLGSLLFILSCSEDDPINQGEQPPAIPPQSTMVMDFSEFPDTSSGALQKISASRNNWSWAAINIAVWNSVLTLTLIVPVAAFAEAFNHEPVKQPDGSWLWEYSVTVQGISHTAKLYGSTGHDSTGTDGIEWRMLLSKDGFYTDFEWFTGFSNLPGTEGTWTLNRDPDMPTPFLHIVWYRSSSGQTANITYTDITPGVPQNGSYIFYGKTDELMFNRFYQIFGAEDNHMVDIRWSYEEHFGRVKDPMHFGDESWYCWDERLDDVDCME